jgi:hypothetical protein
LTESLDAEEAGDFGGCISLGYGRPSILVQRILWIIHWW